MRWGKEGGYLVEPRAGRLRRKRGRFMTLAIDLSCGSLVAYLWAITSNWTPFFEGRGWAVHFLGMILLWCGVGRIVELLIGREL